jgi:hypothetical protein
MRGYGLAGFIAIAALTATAFLMHRRLPETTPPPPGGEDPRLTYATPYLNVHPEVGYIGDAACWGCHPKQAESYKRHPMFRTLSPIASEAGPERYQGKSASAFEAWGFVFQANRDGKRVVHRESARGRDGELLTEFQTEVQYAIGSGTHGCSFLIERDGFLFQSPLSWFSQKKIWAISPGYDEDHPHFQRPVREECLFCHSNRANAVAGTVNRYKSPVFDGLGIGCERCHGPGEKHVVTGGGQAADGSARTIVNPKDLEPSLREAVCEQCHLEGDVRVLRRGRAVFDFRPGLPLDLFWTVFVKAEQDASENPVVGQVEQMHESLCYRRSKGDMGCVSCHDPHRMPEPDEKLTYYRDRCMNCHHRKPCALEAAERVQRAQDNCVSCHMPRVSSTDVAHNSITDHRVPRSATGRAPAAANARAPGSRPLVRYPRALVETGEMDFERDLGIALCRSSSVDLRLPLLSAEVERMLEQAVKAWPNDVEAWCSLGHVRVLRARPTQALTAYERALAMDPDNELAVVGAASVLAVTPNADVEQEVRHWRHAITIDPLRSHYHSQLAQAFARNKQWGLAGDEYQAALRLNPANLDDRKEFVRCLTRQGKHDEARSQLQKWLAMQAVGAASEGR